MKYRPILFNGDMVRAILDGRKTQTRRVVKPARDRDFSGCEIAPCEIAAEVNGADPDYSFSPYGQPGDRLWVRESFRPVFVGGFTNYGDGGKERFEHYLIEYLAGGVADYEFFNGSPEPGTPGTVDRDMLYRMADSGPVSGNRPSIHMPRWASRITLEITGVRVERLQEISRGDAMSEGCPFPNMADGESPARWFLDLWQSINGPGSWDANPWVWVIEFRRITQGDTP